MNELKLYTDSQRSVEPLLLEINSLLIFEINTDKEISGYRALVDDVVGTEEKSNTLGAKKLFIVVDEGHEYSIGLRLGDVASGALFPRFKGIVNNRQITKTYIPASQSLVLDGWTAIYRVEVVNVIAKGRFNYLELQIR
jgi:hypothetical protein